MASKKEAKKQYQHYVPAVRVVPDWYKNFNFVLITSMEELEKVFSSVETKKFYMGFDTETTGLNFEELELVGDSFCLDGKTSYYVPIYHFEYEFNLGEPAVEFIYQKMCEANKVFMYNARYDMRVFEFRGYRENRDKLKNKRFKYVKYDMSKVDYYDVAVPVWNSDTNQKMPSLKWASAHFLGFEQMHFDEVVEGAGNFFYLNPSDNFDAVYYAAADALCTYLLVPVTMKYFQEGGLATKVDNKVLYPLMHYEEEKLRLDKEKVSSMLSECQEEADRLEREVYDMLGFQINLRSPVQVAQAFQRLGIDTGEKTESGGMATGIKVLEGLSDEVKEKFPALKSFVQYKETAKLLNSYFEVLQKEADRNGFLRGAYQTTNVPTGRLSAGKDAKNTYFSPMNLQALPKPHVLMYDVFDTGDRYLQDSKNNIILGYKFVPAQYDTDGNHIVPTDSSYMGLAEGMNPKLNVRSCIIPKTYEDDDVDEWVYCAADYAAQELRITANISREPVWMDAFIHGRDVHRSTAEKLWGAENYNKDLRKRAKGVNFGVVYGMGASSLIDPHYGINTLAEAEEFFNNYKSALPTLFQWIDRVQRGARRKGSVSTYFGRPRRVKCYYDQHNAGFANRTAVNTQIQGTAGDMLKIVMCRLWNNLLDNPDYRDDVRFMITIHDEIGYAVRRSRVYEIMDLIEKNQTIVLKEWPVPIITEISAGTSVGNIFAFEKYEDPNSKTGFYYRPKLD